jgi:hypothetical protein
MNVAAIAFVMCAVTGLLSSTALAQTSREQALNDPEVQKLLRAMNNAGTWYHPDLDGEFSGIHAYAHGDFAAAMKFFERGAHYGDKLSQLSVGLMYLNGEGVAKDPVRALAWVELAAERGYPNYVATRESVKASLTPDQLSQAAVLAKELGEIYADAVAKPRLAKQMRLGRMQLTGSRTGFDFGPQNPPPAFGYNWAGITDSKNCIAYENVVLGAGLENPVSGCGGSNLNAKARWSPDQYFTARDTLWKATVDVGALSTGGEPETPPPRIDTDAKHLR